MAPASIVFLDPLFLFQTPDENDESRFHCNNICWKVQITEWVGSAVMLLTHVREVLGSNPGGDTGSPDRSFSWFSLPQGKYRDSPTIRLQFFSRLLSTIHCYEACLPTVP
jgi:hypothetical protein